MYMSELSNDIIGFIAKVEREKKKLEWLLIKGYIGNVFF